MALERKVNMDHFTERVESKADKQMVLNAVINKVSKIELDQVLQSKCERRDVEAALSQVQARLDEELATMSYELATKATLEDV